MLLLIKLLEFYLLILRKKHLEMYEKMLKFTF